VLNLPSLVFMCSRCLFQCPTGLIYYLEEVSKLSETFFCPTVQEDHLKVLKRVGKRGCFQNNKKCGEKPLSLTFTRLSVFLSVFYKFHFFIRLVYMSDYLSFCPFVCPSVRPSVCSSIRPTVNLSTCLSPCLPTHLSVCCLSVMCPSLPTCHSGLSSLCSPVCPSPCLPRCLPGCLAVK
jgi:hypothetical protein